MSLRKLLLDGPHLRAVTAWLGGSLALICATQIYNPLLLPWRNLLLGLSLALPVAVVPLLWRRRRSAALLWLAALLIASTIQGQFVWRRHAVLHDHSPLAQALGAHLVVGYTDAAQVRTLAERGLIGGIYLGTHNLRGRSIADIRAEIDGFQNARRAAGLPPLLVATDQEGGLVSRASPPLPALPSLATVIANAPADAIGDLAFAYGEAHGRGLALLGVTVNFAPVADLAEPGQRYRFDLHSHIGARAIASDPQRVALAVSAYANGIESVGLRATLKHFPGLGGADADTHIFPAALAAGTDDLAQRDWIPFRDGLRHSHALLMVGHATLQSIDNALPASLSHRVIQGVVREGWGHDGPIITDDLSMGAVARHGLCSAGIAALNVGVDLLLVSYDIDQYYPILYCLGQAARDGRLDSTQRAASARRLRA